MYSVHKGGPAIAHLPGAQYRLNEALKIQENLIKIDCKLQKKTVLSRYGNREGAVTKKMQWVPTQNYNTFYAFF